MTNINATDIQSGFLLTRQVQDKGRSLVITLWLKTVNGAVKLEINNEQAVFFIESEVSNKAKDLLQAQHVLIDHYKNLPLKTFNHQLVTGLYFNNMRSFYRARDILKEHNIKCYEDDLRADDRFLMERHITAELDYIGIINNSSHNFSQSNIEYQSIDNAVQASPLQAYSLDSQFNHKSTFQSLSQVKCKKAVQKLNLKLSMLSIDIECSAKGELYSIGLYANNSADVYARVLMIGEREANADAYIHWLEDEKALLFQFIKEVNAFDADILIGWNVINFDFMLLQKRCDLHGIKFSIGRDRSLPSWRKNINNEQQNFIEIAGRVVLDGIDLLKTATYSFPSFSLDNVAKALLGLTKKVEDVDNRLKEITDNFLNNKQALAAYNLEDCRLVWLIFEKTQLLEFAQLRAQLTGLSIDRIGGSVAAFTNLYLPKLHRNGYIAPNMGDGASELVSPGGYVMDSKPGLYNNVLVLDFKSLYPSIIRTFKIDPMGLIEGLKCVDSQGNADNVISGFDGAFFSRTSHFLPRIIESLWSERDKAKQQKNSALSQAIKIIMNSFYGVLGSTGCRFYDPRLSGSITKRSHQILTETGDWIDALGHQVIYGDTDSIFVYIGDSASKAEAIELGLSLQSYINEKWQKKLKDTFNLESQLDIEFETHFTKFFMPAIRGAHQYRDSKHSTKQKAIGTKKRYAGMSEGALIFKGLETVRSDWTDLSKTFQQELYRLIFNDQPVEKYIKQVVSQLKTGVHDVDLIYTKKIRRRLDEYVNTPPHIRAAIIANTKLKAVGKSPKYNHRSVIRYVMTLEGVQPIEFTTSKLDYDFYIEKQLKPIADDILPFIGKDFDSIAGKQIGLF